MSLKVILELQGHQYDLSEGEEVDIDHLEVEEGKTFKTDKVLAIIEDQKVEMGQPYLPNVKAELKVLKQFKGPKTSEFHFKAKSHYRRHRGFRRQLTRVQLLKVITKTTKPTKVKAKATK